MNYLQYIELCLYNIRSDESGYSRLQETQRLADVDDAIGKLKYCYRDIILIDI